MGSKSKLTLFVAACSVVPSFLQYQRGNLVLTGLLFNTMLALLFSTIAVTFLYAVVAIFKIENLQSEIRERVSFGQGTEGDENGPTR